MTQQMRTDAPVSVDFPATSDGSRPTTATVTGMVADAIRGTQPSLAQQVSDTAKWRTEYVEIVRNLTLASAQDSHSAAAIARDGMTSAYRRFVMTDETGAETALADWDFDAAVEAARSARAQSPAGQDTTVVRGSAHPATELAIPYRGQELRGDALRQQLDEWVARGVIEPSAATAVRTVIDHPEWLSLPGHTVAMVGAGAEMGPLEMLLKWGATVLAVDIPRVTDRLVALAEKGAGELRLPVAADGLVGGDIVNNTAAIAAWLDDHADTDDIVYGMYAYADSGMHLRLTLAADLIGQYLQRKRPRTVLANLATPTDAFVVPPEVVDAAHAGFANRGRRGKVEDIVRTATRGAFFTKPYPKNTPGSVGVADCIISQQGPNYSIAKRLQRWRAVVSEADGHRVSFNVAPATMTRSVTKNPALKAAYGGAHHFQVEVFQPETSRALMAALLVFDVMRDDLPLGTAVPREHPEQLFSDGAAHGGLWRVAWAPRSALTVAAVCGAPALLKKQPAAKRSTESRSPKARSTVRQSDSKPSAPDQSAAK